MLGYEIVYFLTPGGEGRALISNVLFIWLDLGIHLVEYLTNNPLIVIPEILVLQDCYGWAGPGCGMTEGAV